jgi:hypothetical protein
VKVTSLRRAFTITAAARPKQRLTFRRCRVYDPLKV